MIVTQGYFIWVWRAMLWAAAIAVLVWLFWQNLVPTGVLVLRHEKGSVTSPISDLHPEKRVIELPEDGASQRFFVDPVYFDAKAPREFDTVTVDITWQNQSQPILELGARRVRGSWGFVLKPLQNKIIDRLDWPCDRYNGVIFCQRSKTYANLSSYFANPGAGKLATYNYVVPDGIARDVMNVDTDIEQYDYLVATYDPPAELGNNRYQQSVTYAWKDFELYINEISLLISAPQLHMGHGQIVVEDITITLARDPLDWRGFWEYVINQARRLRR